MDFVSSARSHLVQVADVVAYNVFRQFLEHGDSWEDEKIQQLPVSLRNDSVAAKECPLRFLDGAQHRLDDLVLIRLRQPHPQRQPQQPSPGGSVIGSSPCGAAVAPARRRGVQRHVVEDRHRSRARSASGSRGARLEVGQQQVVHVRVVLAIRRARPAAAAAPPPRRRRTPRGSGPRARSRRAVISRACSSCAHRNAAMISLGRNEEPRSTQVYLSTSPRKNALRLVPFSQHDLGALGAAPGR